MEKKNSLFLNSKGNMRDSFLIIHCLDYSLFIPEGMHRGLHLLWNRLLQLHAPGLRVRLRQGQGHWHPQHCHQPHAEPTHLQPPEP